jgi:hypothetical protein
MCLCVRLAEAVVADVGVPLCRGHVGVPQEFLDGTEVRAAIEQMGGESMS